MIFWELRILLLLKYNKLSLRPVVSEISFEDAEEKEQMRHKSSPSDVNGHTKDEQVLSLFDEHDNIEINDFRFCCCEQFLRSVRFPSLEFLNIFAF